MATTELTASEFGLFQPVSNGALRTMAAGAGDWSLLIVHEVDRILEQTQGDRPKAFAQGINELLIRQVISKDEAVLLGDIIAAFLTTQANGEGNAQAQAKVIDGYRQLLLGANTSAAAIAIASVAARYTANAEAQPSAASGGLEAKLAIIPGSPGAGAVTGAIIGAGIGALAGGAVGAAIGAGIGAAAGAAVGWSNEKGK